MGLWALFVQLLFIALQGSSYPNGKDSGTFRSRLNGWLGVYFVTVVGVGYFVVKVVGPISGTFYRFAQRPIDTDDRRVDSTSTFSSFVPTAFRLVHNCHATPWGAFFGS